MGRSVLQDEIKKRRPFDSAAEEVILNLLRTNDVVQSGFARLFKEHGLSSPQYNVLRILRGEGRPLPCLEIASRMVTREPDMTRLIDRLERKACVGRARTEHDRRVVLVAITEAGLAVLARLDQAVAGLDRALLGHLAPDELDDLNRLLVKARQPNAGTTPPA